jgi:hypothetical protein
MAMGLMKGTKELSAAAKAQATYALIMEQTTLAQGDFARTSDGLANQQKILSSTFEDIKAKVGTGLLPLMTTLTQTVSGLFANPAFQAGLQNFINGVAGLAQQVITYIPQVIAWFEQVAAWFTNNQGVIVGILAAIGTAIASFAYTTAVAMGTVIMGMLPVIAVMALIGVAAFLLYQAWTNNWGGIRDTLTALWEGTIKPALSALWTWLQVNLPVALAWLSNTWTTVLLPAIMGVWAWMNAVLFPFFVALANFLGAVFSVAVTALAGIWQNVLQPALQDALPILKDIFAWVGEKLTPAFGWLSQAIKDVTSFLADLTNALKNIHLPAWMTPGSPTPWEVGLRGVASAMTSLSNTALPELKSELAFSGVSGVAGVGGGNGNQDNRQFIWQYSGNATQQQINQSYEMARLMS